MPQDVEESPSLSPKEIQERGYYWDTNTYLSPQEAQVVSRLKEMHKLDICEELDIEKSHLDSLIHHRIPDKLKKAELTVDEMRGMFKYSKQTPKPHPHARAYIGCSNAECETDVNTATQNPKFENFYTKTINSHDQASQISNEIVLHFCSLECLNRFEELVRR